MTGLKPSQPILIVDDSDDDYDATVRALSKNGGLPNPLVRCTSGQQAIDYLLGRGAYKDVEKLSPGLILLDLNLPGIDGRKVLAELKSDETLRGIPVVVMTNSDSEQDIRASYRLGANTYMRKPFEWADFLKAIQRLKDYWFELAVLPKP